MIVSGGHSRSGAWLFNEPRSSTAAREMMAMPVSHDLNGDMLVDGNQFTEYIDVAATGNEMGIPRECAFTYDADRSTEPMYLSI